jgi:hypothetical protein
VKKLNNDFNVADIQFLKGNKKVYFVGQSKENGNISNLEDQLSIGSSNIPSMGQVRQLAEKYG